MTLQSQFSGTDNDSRSVNLAFSLQGRFPDNTCISFAQLIRGIDGEFWVLQITAQSSTEKPP